jgi:Fe-Mn family superoxide dismutase
MNGKYILPKLPDKKNALERVISEKQLTIHHYKHNQGYVNNSNSILEKIEKARKEGSNAFFLYGNFGNLYFPFIHFFTSF